MWMNRNNEAGECLSSMDAIINGWSFPKVSSSRKVFRLMVRLWTFYWKHILMVVSVSTSGIGSISPNGRCDMQRGPIIKGR